MIHVLVTHIFYADDICLLAPSALGLQLLLDVCGQYGLNHDIIYHPVKTKCMVFKPARYDLNIVQMHLHENVLVYTRDIKYLGVMISDDLKDNLDMSCKLRILYAGANTILSKFAQCSIPVKCMLVESFCLNIYCSYLWFNYSKENISKIRVADNNIYRKLLGIAEEIVPVPLYNRINDFYARFRHSCYGFIRRLKQSTNSLVNTIANNNNLFT